MKVLVIEDDREVAAYLRKGLTENGFVVDLAHNAENGLHMGVQGSYDAMILDVMLPDHDGWWLLSELKRSGAAAPVLFLSARDAVPDRVRGLELGADDYLVKPFAFTELLARVRTILRRAPTRNPEVLQIADLQLDLVRHRVKRAGKRVELTPKEFAMLSLLVRRPGQPLSRTVIAEQVWDMNFDSDTNVIDVHMRRLRAKIDDPFPQKLIRTIRSVGYMLDDAPEESEVAAEAPSRDPQASMVGGLWDRLHGTLAARLDSLQQAVTALAEGRLDESARQEAVREAHKLAGALGTFGLDEASRSARQIESLLESPRLQDAARAAGLIDEMQRQLRSHRPS